MDLHIRNCSFWKYSSLWYLFVPLQHFSPNYTVISPTPNDREKIWLIARNSVTSDFVNHQDIKNICTLIIQPLHIKVEEVIETFDMGFDDSTMDMWI